MFFDQAKLDVKVQNSKVLKYKEYIQWDFQILLELFENDGVLWTEDRLEFYMERTKFIKRLLAFYMPSKYRFVNLEWKQENMIYAKVGFLLLKTLLKSEQGKKNLNG